MQDASLLSNFCFLLEKQRAECDQLIKTYGPVITELIAESADPSTVCRYLGLCQGSLIVVKQTPYTCNICQFIISRMKLFFGLSKNEKDIRDSLKGSCDLFSLDNLRKQCHDFLDQYEAQFSSIISDEIEPKIACRAVGICTDPHKESTTTTAAPEESTTKAGKCIFGMNYWCISRENAQLCNVRVTHCAD